MMYPLRPTTAILLALLGFAASLFASPTAYENWKAEHNIPNDTADTHDGDGDGLGLLLEYAVGADPAAFDPSPLVGRFNTEGDRYELSFRQLRAELIYYVEISSDLAEWTTEGVDQELGGATLALADKPLLARLAVAGGRVNPNALFVSTTGDDAANGNTRATALRTIAEAVRQAGAGKTIYVEAGTYAGETIVFGRNGRVDAPITLEGYHLEPGDYPTRPNFDHTTAVDPALMPVLDGLDRSLATAITASGRKHIRVRNLQITNYRGGLYGYRSSHVQARHLYLSTFGVNEASSYSGVGIKFGSFATFNRVQDCVVVNAGAEGIMLIGDDNLASASRVYNSDGGGSNANPTDYYMMIQGNRNLIEGSEVHRIGNPSHGGHGIGIKGFGTNNLIKANLAVGFSGSPFYARHRGVTDNTYRDNTARDGGLGMTFRDGASDNLVENFTAERTRAGVVFFDTSEDEEQQFSGAGNTVRDSTFTDLTGAVVWLHDYIYNDSYARRNIIENIEVDGAPLLFDVRSFGADNELRNSTICNVAGYLSAKAPRVADDLGFSLSGNSGTGNGFDF